MKKQTRTKKNKDKRDKGRKKRGQTITDRERRDIRNTQTIETDININRQTQKQTQHSNTK